MNYNEARDAMLGVFYSAWGTANPVVWDDLPATPPGDEVPWAKVLIKHSGGHQASLAGVNNVRRYARYGIIRIQIYVPAGGGQTNAYQLAQQVSNAFEDAKLEVWFRNTRIREMGVSGAFMQINVLSDFHYDEVR